MWTYLPLSPSHPGTVVSLALSSSWWCLSPFPTQFSFLVGSPWLAPRNFKFFSHGADECSTLQFQSKNSAVGHFCLFKILQGLSNPGMVLLFSEEITPLIQSPFLENIHGFIKQSPPTLHPALFTFGDDIAIHQTLLSFLPTLVLVFFRAGLQEIQLHYCIVMLHLWTLNILHLIMILFNLDILTF